MNEVIFVIMLAALLVLTAIIIFLVARYGLKNKNGAEHLTPISSAEANQRRKPTPVNTVQTFSASSSLSSGTHRLPRLADDKEYLNYRKCPACRTVNTTAKQYIFKTGNNRFECKRCGKKFNL